MSRNKRLMMAALIAVSVGVPRAVAGIAGGREVLWRLGVSLCVEPRWVALDGYWTERDRGADAREQAWAGKIPPRVAPEVHSVRLAAVPRPIENMRRNFVIARVLGGAAFTVARHFAGASDDPSVTPETGVRDADRR